MGRVTGRGLAGNIRRHYPAWLLYPLVGLLVVANTINLGADLGAMAAALHLLIDGPTSSTSPASRILTVVAEVFITYARYASVLRWLTLSLFAYVGIGVRGWRALADCGEEPRPAAYQPDWRLSHRRRRRVRHDDQPLSLLLAGGRGGRGRKGGPGRQAAIRAPQQAPAQMARMQLDTLVGMGFSNIIALFIMLTTAATLNAHGVTDIQTSSQAAEALRPIAGRFAFTIFALGIIGTGLLAVPVLAGSAAYAVGEALRWRVGLAQRPGRAPAFYGAIALATLIGASLNFTPLDPIKALFWSAVINGVAAVPIMVMIMLMASRKEVMGQFALRPLLKAFGWLATAVMTVAAIGMFATWGA